MVDKRLYGQYFTITNPFDTAPFYQWINEIEENIKEVKILEPFAGGNNIPRMIYDSDILSNTWNCYDISPAKNQFPKFPIKTLDTITSFPKGYKLCITNPPYLSKNSATRRGLSYPQTKYDDIYKLCLAIMLKNVEYVAAIVPETFINSGLFQDRLKYYVSLTCKMFDDTDCPVCLAMFSSDKTDDFYIYQMNERLGTYRELLKGDVIPAQNHHWKINDPNGNVGIKCIDNAKEPSISFCHGSDIFSHIKSTSRSITRVSGLPNGVDLDKFINYCNKILNEYRAATKDVFMASFKGLRADGKYRRRLDFFTAKNIMSKALCEVAK